MVRLGPGLIVLIRFPFSDLSSSKLRPAVVLAHAGGVDWTLCQVTSNAYGDSEALLLTGASFASGGLPRDSFVRPGKLFTASESIAVRVAGSLTPGACRGAVDQVVRVIQSRGQAREPSNNRMELTARLSAAALSTERAGRGRLVPAIRRAPAPQLTGSIGRRNR